MSVSITELDLFNNAVSEALKLVKLGGMTDDEVEASTTKLINHFSPKSITLKKVLGISPTSNPKGGMERMKADLVKLLKKANTWKAPNEVPPAFVFGAGIKRDTQPLVAAVEAIAAPTTPNGTVIMYMHGKSKGKKGYHMVIVSIDNVEVQAFASEDQTWLVSQPTGRYKVSTWGPTKGQQVPVKVKVNIYTLLPKATEQKRFDEELELSTMAWNETEQWWMS